MKIDLRKLLMTGTAVVAVSAFGANEAFAQTAVNATASGEWADGGGMTDDGTLAEAVAGAAVGISGDGVTVTVVNDGANNDGSANTNTFALGAITDTSAANDGAVTITTGAAADLTVGIASAAIDGVFSVLNTANDGDIAATLTGALSAGTLTVNAAADATTADALTLTVGGATTIGAGASAITASGNAGAAATLVDLNGNATFGGALTVTGGTNAGSTATLALSGATNTFTGGLTLTDGAAGAAILNLDGATQTLAGNIMGNGDINVSSTVGTTFSGTVTSGTVVIEGTGADTSATFQNTLTSALTLGTDGAGDTNTLNLDTQTQGFTVTGAVGGTAGETNNIAVTGNNTLTHTGGAIGAGGEIDLLSVAGLNTIFTTDQNVTATNFTVASGSTLATTGNTLTGALALTGTLLLNGGDFTGDIQGGSGTIDVDMNATITGNIGNTTQVTTMDVATGANATVTGSVNVGTTTLNGTGQLSMTTGNNLTTTLRAAADGDGTLNFTDTTATSVITGALGTSTAAIGALTVAAGANNAVIQSSGNLFVDAIQIGAGDTFQLLGTSQSVSGTIATAGDNQGILTVGDGATASNVTFNGIIGNGGANGLATFTGTAMSTATFNANADFDTGATNTGTVILAPDVNFTAADQTAAAGTWTFQVSNDDPANADATDATTVASGTLLVGGGNDVDLTGATVTISVAGTSSPILNGQEFLIADGGGAITGGPLAVETAVADDSFIYDFVIVDGTGANIDTAGGDNTQLFAIASQNNLATNSTTTNNSNAANVILNGLAASTNTQINQVQGSIASASTSQEFNERVEAIQPTVDGGNVVAAMNVVNNSFSIMSDRLASLRGGNEGTTGMSAGGHMSEGVRFWAQGFGATAEQDSRDGIDGYDADTFGVAVGVDSENVFEDTVMGVAFSYADTEVDSENANTTNTEVDSYQLAVYGDHDIDQRTYFNGMVAYTFSDNDTRRNNVGGVSGLTASGDFDADQFTVRGELGRDYSYEGATLTPNVLAHWSHYDPDGYTETGAGGAGLVVDGDALDIFELGVGLDVSWLYQNSDGSHFSPELEVGFRYDFADDNVEATSRFVGGGASFQTEGFDSQNSTLDLGAGFTYFSTDNWELSAEYDFELKEDYDAHSGLFRAAYRF